MLCLWCDVSEEIKQAMGESMDYYIGSVGIDGAGC